MLLFCREQVIKHSLVHKVFLDFFMLAPDKQRTVGNVGHVWTFDKKSSDKSDPCVQM